MGCRPDEPGGEPAKRMINNLPDAGHQIPDTLIKLTHVQKLSKNYHQRLAQEPKHRFDQYRRTGDRYGRGHAHRNVGVG